MVELERELAMTRLLTITGAGGSGKTRLALEVARDLLEAYPDGVWLVELAPLSEEALVPKAVAEALEVPERPGEPLTDTLAEVLRDRQLLLILDNCEHLLEATARLVDKVLDSCPSVRILATSREAIGVEGEIRWLIPPLSTPEMGRTSPLEELGAYESVRLFVERAKGRDPSFSLSPHNAFGVAEICRGLEGIPLAIELAAARVGTLSVEQISQRLANSLKLLTGGSKTQMPKQRTLRGALDWSYELLSEDEKELSRLLSVFAGGWTLEAAEAVGAGGGVEEDDILDVLSGLVEKSLVVTETIREGGTVRYRLLEPIRQYAREKLQHCGESEAAKRAHAEYFLALAEEAEPELFGPREAEWFDRLEVEHDNFRAALSWTIEQGENETALRLAAALWQFWFARGYSDEGQRWLEQALSEDGQESAAARAKALEALAWLADVQEDMERAEAAAKEGLRLSEGAGVDGSLAASLRSVLGEVAATRGDHERAKELYEESLALYQKVGDRRFVTRVLVLLGNLSIERGDYEQAKELYEESVASARELGEETGIGVALGALGYVFLLEGEQGRAKALFEEAEALLRQRGHRGFLIGAIDNLGWAALLRGDHERARGYYEESFTLCKELGDKLIASESLEGVACIIGAKGDAERAARLFGAALALREVVGYHHTPEEDAWREPYLAAARSQVGEEPWEEALAQGRAMSMEEAIEYALSTEESFATTPSTTTDKSSPSSKPEHLAGLTSREVEVLRFVALGMTSAQIAKELFLSPRTVETHIASIYHKLGVTSRAAATRFALEHDLA